LLITEKIVCQRAIQVNSFTTLVEILQDRANRQPDKRIYSFLHGDDRQQSLTHVELNARARVLATKLRDTCQPGDRALLLYPPGLDYIVALFACMYAGVIAVPSYAPRPNRPFTRLESVISSAQPKLVLTTAEFVNSPRSIFRQEYGPLASLQRFDTDKVGLESENGWTPVSVSADTPVLLQYTSGSTASPKGVILTHGNIIHNTSIIQRNFPLSEESSTVFWLPPYHDMGLIGGILQPLCTGFPVHLLSPVAFLQRPARWLQAISRFQATCSGGPNFAYELCVRRIGEEEINELDLSSWTVAFNGAEPIRKQTLDDFCEKFASCGFRRESLHPCYGLAEATLMATGIEPMQNLKFKNVSRNALEKGMVETPNREQDGCLLVSCGPGADGQNVRIVDPVTLFPCDPGRIGEVWLSGPSVALGYWGKPQETEETFCANLADGTGPFLRTGDLGFLAEGELYITGRIKDLIIIRGQNHYPHDIEFTAQRSHPSLASSSSAAFSVQRDGFERLLIVQEIGGRPEATDLKEIVARISQSVTETHDLQVHEVLPVRPWTIPRTTSGKIQRYLCRAAYLDGTLQTIA
jgi:acyl-CoA synthetase (AMP-forming)/AMP-acid ligase II